MARAYSQTLAATGGTPPYQWAAGTAFPAFLALDTTSGTVSGTPTSGGTFSFPIQVADSANHTSTSTVTLTVNSPPISITTLAPIFNGTVAVPYVQTFRAAGGNPPYTWAITQGDPGGLSINATTGDLQGTPQTAGTFNFTVQAADRSGATATQSYSLVINPPTLLITVVSPLPAGAVGVAYSQKLPVAVSGGTPPYTWSVISGSVPGLTFDPATLTLSGTPTAGGSYNLTVQATDSTNLSATKSLSLTVNAASLSITTARQLPDGKLNQPYSQSIAAAGGQPPYRWSANGLPAGLTINSTTGLDHRHAHRRRQLRRRHHRQR